MVRSLALIPKTTGCRFRLFSQNPDRFVELLALMLESSLAIFDLPNHVPGRFEECGLTNHDVF